MYGAHDLGGKDGLGFIDPEPENEGGDLTRNPEFLWFAFGLPKD